MRPFQAFLDDHAETMWRVCVAAAGRQDAEDAFQEACLSALRGWDGRTVRDERGFAVTLAQRRAIDLHRGRARRPTVSVEVVGEAPGDAFAPPPDVEDPVWDAVRTLPDGQRAAVTLRYAADLTPSEVAAALDITPEAARRRVADGLAALRRRTAR